MQFKGHYDLADMSDEEFETIKQAMPEPMRARLDNDRAEAIQTKKFNEQAARFGTLDKDDGFMRITRSEWSAIVTLAQYVHCQENSLPQDKLVMSFIAAAQASLEDGIAEYQHFLKESIRIGEERYPQNAWHSNARHWASLATSIGAVAELLKLGRQTQELDEKARGDALLKREFSDLDLDLEP